MDAVGKGGVADGSEEQISDILGMNEEAVQGSPAQH
jgi:hypothetical protein